MTKEELKKATGQELIDERNYCGVDGYYGVYLDNVNAEMLKRFNRLAELEKRCNELFFQVNEKTERIADLEKENAELKKELKNWKDEWQEQVQKANDESYARTLQTIQLTKAKEIIREFVEWANWQSNSECPSFKSIQHKAEQFLSEVEK